MTPDMECTHWPDITLKVVLTPCCQKHDLGGTALELAVCVFWRFYDVDPTLAVLGALIGTVMAVGVTLAWPYYRLKRWIEDRRRPW